MSSDDDILGAAIRGDQGCAPEGVKTEAAKKALEELRVRLLDLKNSNKLLNFRHSERSRTHVRIIDELPDCLMPKLLAGGSLTFRSLPEPEDEPADEHAPDFLKTLDEARATDEAYLAAIEKIDGDDAESAEALVIERELKDRVRGHLGMPPRMNVETISIADYARTHGLDPNYDLPDPGVEIVAAS